MNINSENEKEDEEIMYFDDVEETNENGVFNVYAIDRESSRCYMLRNVVINTVNCAVDGLMLNINSYPNQYTYRGKFIDKEDMDNFSKKICSLILQADIKNNKAV